MKKILFIFSIVVLAASNSIAQYDEFYENLLMDDEENIESLAFKPIIGFGEGVVNFYGDVNNAYRQNPFDGNYASTMNVSRKLNSFLSINFLFMYGKLTGNELGPTRYLNFETDLLNGGISLTYNFKHLINANQPIRPFISLGIETFQFASKGDLKTYINGTEYTYNYWSDGTIRSLPETDPRAFQSIILNRDYIYETNLRDENFDGLGRYSQVAFALPIDIGIDLTITDRMTMRLGNSFHYTFTDYIDDISKNSKGIRQGNKLNDGFLYTYVSFQFDLFSPIEDIAVVENFKTVKYVITDNVDSDGDKVDDFNDNCPDTPPGVAVNYEGCPLDDDDDGIPNYIDKQDNTPRDSRAVGLDGIKTLDSELIALLYDPDAIDHKDVFKYYPGANTKTKTKKEYTEIPQKFKSLDTDGDSYISIDELQKAINSLFDFSTDLSVDDINDLIDFFFEQ
ncbi:MAG: EF-hand domain-containing protein [Chlorobi bacterium]|nr:EF-hand domain-containing protein [Chlorobiota bacterium]